MVGEGMRHYADAQATQHLEEALRIADAGDRVHPVPAERGQGAAASATQRQGVIGTQLHPPFAETGFPAIDHAEVAFGAALRWLPQRASRQQAPVAVAAASVDHLDLDIAAQPVMLQAIVADDHIAARRRQLACGGYTVAIHANLRAGATCDEYRLVATFGRCRV